MIPTSPFHVVAQPALPGQFQERPGAAAGRMVPPHAEAREVQLQGAHRGVAPVHAVHAPEVGAEGARVAGGQEGARHTPDSLVAVVGRE